MSASPEEELADRGGRPGMSTSKRHYLLWLLSAWKRDSAVISTSLRQFVRYLMGASRRVSGLVLLSAVPTQVLAW